jgi:2-keto-3-deoxy-L-rhamnonate aldolase RhmA
VVSRAAEEDYVTVRTQNRVPPELLERILKLAGIDMILVGGQALAF